MRVSIAAEVKPGPTVIRGRGLPMSFDPHLSMRAAILAYFSARADQFAGLTPHIEALIANPTLDSGSRMLRAYFRMHHKGDIDSLRMITATFADKRIVRAIASSILNDEAALSAIA